MLFVVLNVSRLFVKNIYFANILRHELCISLRPDKYIYAYSLFYENNLVHENNLVETIISH